MIILNSKTLKQFVKIKNQVPTFISSGSFNITYDLPNILIWTIGPYFCNILPKNGKSSEKNQV